MTEVAYYISPVDPAGRAHYLQANINNGRDLLRGASSIEEGFLITGEHPTGPVVVPPPLVLRPTRPSGWVPFWLAVSSPVVAALLAWAATR